MSSENALVMVGPEDGEEPVSAKPARRETTALSPTVGNRGLVLSNMDDMIRFAKIASESGLAPKGMDTPQKVFIGLAMGAELGLSPMMSLQNIGVINGKAGPYGQCALTLCRQSRILEEFEEWYELRPGGEKLDHLPEYPDTAAAVCYSKRIGKPGLTTRFSVADAKRAKLWGKEGTWTTYPWRMLKFRARGFNLSDNFPDVLLGYKTFEELRDYPSEEEETPAGNARPTADTFLPSQAKTEGGATEPAAPANGGKPAPPSPEDARLLAEEKARFAVLAKQSGFASGQELKAYFAEKGLRAASELEYHQKANGLLEERIQFLRDEAIAGMPPDAEEEDFIPDDDPFAGDPPGDAPAPPQDLSHDRADLLAYIDGLEAEIEPDSARRGRMCLGWRTQAKVHKELEKQTDEQLRQYAKWLEEFRDQ